MAVVAWLAVSLVFFRLDLVHGLYFHMGETEKKCFIEEIPDETMVIGEFTVKIHKNCLEGDKLRPFFMASILSLSLLLFELCHIFIDTYW